MRLREQIESEIFNAKDIKHLWGIYNDFAILIDYPEFQKIAAALGRELPKCKSTLAGWIRSEPNTPSQIETGLKWALTKQQFTGSELINHLRKNSNTDKLTTGKYVIDTLISRGTIKRVKRNHYQLVAA